MSNKETLKKLLDRYLQFINEVVGREHYTQEYEGYKFDFVSNFQKGFDVEAKNLPEMLDRAIQNNNLVVSNRYYPRAMLLHFARNYERNTRKALQDLFKKEVGVVVRIDNFRETMDGLMKKENEKTGRDDHSFMQLRFISLLLASRYPEDYYAIKPSEYNRFIKWKDERSQSLGGLSGGEKYKIYEKHADEVNAFIRNIPEIQKIHSLMTKDRIFKDPEYRWMTQDFMYTAGRKDLDQEIGERDLRPSKETTKTIEVLPMPVRKINIKPDSLSFDELLKGVDKRLIQIPPFQRNFVWSPKEIVYLLDSIYRGYPIGSFIFWKTTRRLKYHRYICGIKIAGPPPIGTPIDYVLDGQQRITSLYAAVMGAKIEEKNLKFFFNLSKGCFDYETISEEEFLNEQQTSAERLINVPLEKLFVKATEYYGYVEGFPAEHKPLLHDLYDRFVKYSFSVVYVEEENNLEKKESEEEDVKQIVQIFTRLNETGRKLTVVAKMIARCWGENFDLRSKLDEFFDSDKRLLEIREQTILQAASTILNNKKSRTRNILEDTNVRELEERWPDIIKAFRQALDFIRNKARMKNLKFLPFDSLLVPLSYFFYKEHSPSPEQSERLAKWFWRASLSNRFGASVEGKYEEDCNIFDEILEGEEVEFDYPIDWETFKQRLIRQNYSLKNAFSKTVFSLYSYMQPKNLIDNSDIDLEKSFSAYSKYNFHHFFPHQYLKKVKFPQRELEHSVVNIAFLPMMSNLKISDRSPSDYIGELKKMNENLSESLRSHLVDDIDAFGVTTGNFNLFLEKRAERIENAFRTLLGLRTKTEEQFESRPSTPIDFFEIRMRDLLNFYLVKEYGENYWEEAIPRKIREKADVIIQEDLRAHPYKETEYVDCRKRLDFLNILDYFGIIQEHWSLFQGIFVSKGELKKHFFALNEYRRMIKHVREQNVVVKKNGEGAILWFERILDRNEEGREENVMS